MRHRLYGGVRGRGREAPPTRLSHQLVIEVSASSFQAIESVLNEMSDWFFKRLQNMKLIFNFYFVLNVGA